MRERQRPLLQPQQARGPHRTDHPQDRMRSARSPALPPRREDRVLDEEKEHAGLLGRRDRLRDRAPVPRSCCTHVDSADAHLPRSPDTILRNNARSRWVPSSHLRAQRTSFYRRRIAIPGAPRGDGPAWSRTPRPGRRASAASQARGGSAGRASRASRSPGAACARVLGAHAVERLAAAHHVAVFAQALDSGFDLHPVAVIYIPYLAPAGERFTLRRVAAEELHLSTLVYRARRQAAAIDVVRRRACCGASHHRCSLSAPANQAAAKLHPVKASGM